MKCPKSEDSRILSEAKAGRVPVEIYWQLQHQLLVSQADLAHLFVFDGKDGILIEQRFETAAWDTIRQDWDAFMGLVRSGEAPALTERDTVVGTDQLWQAAAETYLALKAERRRQLDSMRRRPRSSAWRSTLR